jgi:GMP synthase (glutamine-hydrolysing)
MKDANTPTEPDNRPLLVVQHVPWEGPHVILDSFPNITVQVRHPLDEPVRTPLPDPDTLRGVVVMGGPMSVNDTDRLPALADEITWLEQAVALKVPILGICLGAQLLAKAAGATINAAPQPEIGVYPITITALDDPLLSHLGHVADAMHWHGEHFTLPDAAMTLAHSAQTQVQAFRLGANAWGLLFHLEVDEELLDIWLAEPSMAAQAKPALGSDYRERLRRGVTTINSEQAHAVFDEFAKHCASQRVSLTGLPSGAL